ncbi:unnamed protein product [Didymodactylos carnosus]|uniref:Phosphoribosyl pyrophosphate synthetase n=1 Tax=Didymodactylos carnosus TaxID=1234261 RepID=A0A815K7W0_9BILA|nr:unnamed protein product [Didymodactylos carnosus]CAF1389681.1 unnamed protein product [Didymodactylos carnosus]CAF4074491.1 unnamed protein product [Didymodactylos carnosus]CAF4284451.1 unnamed protein product [Didymodactylos carnosus]
MTDSNTIVSANDKTPVRTVSLIKSLSRDLRSLDLHNDHPILLVYAREMKLLATEICMFSNQLIKLGEIEWNLFPDTWPNLFIKHSEVIRNSHVIYLASLHNPSTIFEQISLLYHLPKYQCISLKVLLPYFPTGTMERIQIQGEIATAYSLAVMLSAVPLTRTGPTEIVTLDIHALQNQFYFSSNVVVRLESTICLLLNELDKEQQNNPHGDKYAIAFPDDGAHKRYSHMFNSCDEKKYEEIICSKIRQDDKRITTLQEGNPQGYHVIIIDDLVQSGGTLLECAKTLKEKGAIKVSAYVTHGIFPNESWKKFLHNNNNTIEKNDVKLDTFWVTNTYPNTEILVDKPPFKVLSIAKLLCNICFN